MNHETFTYKQLGTGVTLTFTIGEPVYKARITDGQVRVISALLLSSDRPSSIGDTRISIQLPDFQEPVTVATCYWYPTKISALHDLLTRIKRKVDEVSVALEEAKATYETAANELEVLQKYVAGHMGM